MCGWRFLKLSDAMRPDRSHILLVPEFGTGAGYEKGGLKLVLCENDRVALASDELLNLLAKCTLSGVPVYLTCGAAFAKQALINEIAKPVVAARRKDEFLKLLYKLFDDLAASVAKAEVRPG